MTYSLYVTMRNVPSAPEDLNRICDREAPAVNTRCVRADHTEITFEISGFTADVDRVYLAGQRERLW